MAKKRKASSSSKKKTTKRKTTKRKTTARKSTIPSLIIMLLENPRNKKPANRNRKGEEFFQD